MSALRLSAAIRPSTPSVLEDRAEFGAAGRHFADRAVEVDVGDQPIIAVAAHQVIDLDRLAIGFDDLALDQDAGRHWVARR